MFACRRRRMPTVAAMLPLCILLALPSRASGQADPGTMVHPEPGSRIDSLLFHAFVFPRQPRSQPGPSLAGGVSMRGHDPASALGNQEAVATGGRRIRPHADATLHPVRQVAGAHVGPAPRCPPSAAWLLLRSYRRWRDPGL